MTPPEISIILATRNRDYVLAHTLAHLARALADSSVELEVVVVDNGSSDSTLDVLRYFSGHLPLVVACEPEAGKNRALNLALRRARGALTVFTDDDVIPENDWIENLRAASRRWDGYEIFGGRILPRYPQGDGPALPDEEFTGWAYSRWELQQDEGPTNRLPFGPNFAVRSSALSGVTLDEAVGPGVGPMGSETTLLKALVGRGCRIVYVPHATVHHVVLPHQLQRAYLLGRAFRLGMGIARWSTDEESPRLAGAPRHLWRELVESWIKGKLSPADTEARLRADLRHQRARGQISAYRHTRQ